MKLDAQGLRDLVDERLPRGRVRAVQSAHKDPGRFDAYIALLQERVPWDDPIVLPFGEHLHIVAKGPGAFVVKCDCGHEFCSHERNWKLEALVRVRDDVESLREVYPEKMHGDPEWNVLREYFCPGCRAQLEVEAVPPGYPVVHDFVPDLEGFYEEWLGRPLPGAAA
ncbi:MAG: acetone carboxylase, gamma subunit [Solirubrobacteraceae bacterium]|nr:acetone carboxylase, gamma subunit [Solirubrobacteraceae bacterium]